MGRDKAFLEVGGRPVIERILARVRPLSDDVFISTNLPEKYAHLGLPGVVDVYPHKAALGGIYSALEAARYQHVLVVACDMPFLNVALLRHLIDLAPTAAVIVPVIEPGQPEVLHAVYSKSCLPAIKARLQANDLRIIDSVRYVARAEVAQFDPDFYSVVNMNTVADWRKVQAIAQELSSPRPPSSPE